MRIQRAHNPAGWTAVPNQLMEDGTLSFKARGLLGYLLSRPEGWETDSERLARSTHASLDGRDAIRSALAELERAGYLSSVRLQGERGRWETRTFVYDQPVDPSLRTATRGRGARKKSVDNPGDELWTTTPTEDGLSGVGPSGAINNTQEQEDASYPAQPQGPPVDNSGSALGRPSGLGKAALGSASPSAAAPGGAEPVAGSAVDDADALPGDSLSAAAVRETAAIAAGVDVFDLRRVLASIYAPDVVDWVDVLDAVRAARDRTSAPSRRTAQAWSVAVLASAWRPRVKPAGSAGTPARSAGEQG